MFIGRQFVIHLVLGVALGFGTAASGREITSFLEPYRDVDVASPEMGTLAVVKVREGDVINEGDVVAVMHDEVLLAALAVAQKSMEARGKLLSAEAELRLQTTQLNKLLQLLERRHSTEGEVARAQAQKAIAAAQVRAVREELEVKVADFERIKAQLALKRIKSPIRGTVTHVYKDPGEFVSASDPVVTKIVQLDPLLVVFSVPASAARKIKAKDDVSLKVGQARKTTKGVIEFVSPTANAQSGTARVKVRIPNSDGEFQSGDGCWLNIPGLNPTTTRHASTTSETVRRRK